MKRRKLSREQLDMIRGELIGLKVRVIKSDNISNIDLEGEVIDETKNLLAIKTKKGIKKVLKEQNTFEFEKNKNKTIVNGKTIQKRPYERIKIEEKNTK